MCLLVGGHFFSFIRATAWLWSYTWSTQWSHGESRINLTKFRYIWKTLPQYNQMHSNSPESLTIFIHFLYLTVEHKLITQWLPLIFVASASHPLMKIIDISLYPDSTGVDIAPNISRKKKASLYIISRHTAQL